MTIPSPALAQATTPSARRPLFALPRFADVARPERVKLEPPGDGGFGNPRAHDPQRVFDDVLDGMITAEEERRDYGVAIVRSRNSTWPGLSA